MAGSCGNSGAPCESSHQVLNIFVGKRVFKFDGLVRSREEQGMPSSSNRSTCGLREMGL
jgi:hypothetical protein